jgi:preprotein translocase SecE subunit
MAISRSKSDSLVETQISGKNVAAQIKPNEDKLKKTPKAKKQGLIRAFISSTWQELLKVEWPSWEYTRNWSAVIVIFTFIFALSVGLIDNVFNSSLKYINCTASITSAPSDDSSKDKEKFGDCNSSLVKNLSFRG